MDYSSKGYLSVYTYTAEQAIPIPNLNVRISGGEESNRGMDISLMTDRNGESRTVELPTPVISYSLAPYPAEQPYAKYDVEITGEGYYPKKLVGVTVFPEIKSILRLEMVPDSEFSRNVNPPVSTNFSIITEQEDL